MERKADVDTKLVNQSCLLTESTGRLPTRIGPEVPKRGSHVTFVFEDFFISPYSSVFRNPALVH